METISKIEEPSEIHCDLCDKAFEDTFTNLQNDNKCMHGKSKIFEWEKTSEGESQTFSCDDCVKVYTQQSHLNHHKRNSLIRTTPSLRCHNATIPRWILSLGDKLTATDRADCPSESYL